jgi:CheY-like chemotaxis protein
MSPASKDILLIAPDLDERRLLLAELREAGYEVLPAPNADYAIRAILLKLTLPSLVLWDEHGGPSTTPADRQRLSSLTPNVPWMVIESAIAPGRQQPLGHPAATVLQRPIRIGQIVEAVRAVVP